METIRLHFVAVLMASLCVSASCEAEDNGDCHFHQLHKQAVEQILSICSAELTKKVGIVETLKSYLHQELTNGYFSVYSYSALLDKRFTDEANNDLSSQDMKEILDFLREENYFATPYPCKEIQFTLLSRCPELFRNRSFFPRRFLRHKRHGHRRDRTEGHVNQGLLVRSNAPNPSPAPVSEIIAQVPAPSPSPISGSPPTKQPPAESPKLPPAASPIPDPPKPPNHVQHVSPPPKQQKSAANQAVYSPPPKQHNNKTLIIASTVTTSVAVTTLIAFCLLWFLKKIKNKRSLKVRNRDDNPLLNVYSSDFSAVPSQKFQTGEISSNEDFKTSTGANNSLAVAGNLVSSGSEGGTTVPEASGDTSTKLPLPPGKLEPPPPLTPQPPPVQPNAPSPPPRPPPKLSPLGPNRNRISSNSEGSGNAGDSDGKKAKMKPFFWDKVQANPDHSMVWHDIKSGSFQFNEDLMESLFGYAPTDQGKKKMSSEAVPNYIKIIDSKKATNLSILLRALNVTTKECCDALHEGTEMPAELVQTLIKMAPSQDEELKLRLFAGDISQLGPAERFLKAIIDIPFAFKRLESIFFMGTFQEELSSVKESLATLEVACKDLKNSRLFLKLLEAVLKTGNRMNDGTYRGGANAFRLDTLLKVSDVKGTDGKTTLLHFVVQEIIRSEGVRAARRLKECQSMSSVQSEDGVDDRTHETEEYHRSLGLQVISGISDELGSVKKAAVIDGNNLRSTVSEIGNSLEKTRKFLQNELKTLEEDSTFQNTLATFLEQKEADVGSLLEEEKRIMALVKSTGDYFHGSSTRDEGLRLFVTVRDFLIILDKVCKELKAETKMPTKTATNEKLTVLPSQESRAESVLDLEKKLFPAIQERRAPNDDFSSSDDER